MSLKPVKVKSVVQNFPSMGESSSPKSHLQIGSASSKFKHSNTLTEKKDKEKLKERMMYLLKLAVQKEMQASNKKKMEVFKENDEFLSMFKSDVSVLSHHNQHLGTESKKEG